MKKIISLLFALMFCVVGGAAMTGCGGSDENTLYVYTNSGFAPFEYVDEAGNVVGVDIDIVTKIGSELGYKVKVYDVAFGSIFTEVQKNTNTIGVAGITISEERLQSGIFSVPYTTSVQYVVVKSGAFTEADLVDGKLPVSKLANLSNKKIGVQESTTGMYLVEDEINGTTDETTSEHVPGSLEDSGAQCLSYANAFLAANDIGTQLGAVVVDKLPAQKICEINTGLVCFELDSEPESYAIYMNKNATELKAKIDEVLTKMINDGTIAQYINKHSGANA